MPAATGKGGTLYAIPLQVISNGFIHKSALSDYAVEKVKGARDRDLIWRWS